MAGWRSHRRDIAGDGRVVLVGRLAVDGVGLAHALRLRRLRLARVIGLRVRVRVKVGVSFLLAAW